MSGEAEGGTHTRKLTVARGGHSDGLLGRPIRQCVCPPRRHPRDGSGRTDARMGGFRFVSFAWGYWGGWGRQLCTAYTCAAGRRGRALGNAEMAVACRWSSRGSGKRGDILGKGVRRTAACHPIRD